MVFLFPRLLGIKYSPRVRPLGGSFGGGLMSGG